MRVSGWVVEDSQFNLGTLVFFCLLCTSFLVASLRFIGPSFCTSVSSLALSCLSLLPGIVSSHVTVLVFLEPSFSVVSCMCGTII